MLTLARFSQAKICLFLLATLLAHAACAQPLSGTYHIGANGDFASISKANGLFAALNERGAQGPVIALVVSDITDEDGSVALMPLDVTASLLIRPSGGARMISGETIGQLSLIAIIGADNVELNGALTASDTDLARKLTIQNTNPEAVAVIEIFSRGFDGAQNIRLRNLNILGAGGNLSSGVHIGNGFSLDSWDIDDFLLENSSIRNVRHGVFGQLDDLGINQRWRIQGNVIEDNTGSGIYLRAVEAPVITANVIRNLSDSCCGIAGIEISFDTLNARIEGNTIQNIRGSESFQPTDGIVVYPGRGDSTTVLVNNMISGIFGPKLGGSGSAIRFSGNNPGTLQVLHNSINLYPPINPNQLASSSVGIALSSPYQGEVKYNIVRCAQPESLPVSSGSRCASVLISVPTASALRFDQNLYQFTGQQSFLATLMTESNGAITSLSSLNSWQTLFGHDLLGRVGDPRFVSDTNLHLRPGGAARQLATGTATAFDIDGEPRNSAIADAGADEGSTDALTADGFE